MPTRKKAKRVEPKWPEFKGPREPVEDEAYWVEPEWDGRSVALLIVLGVVGLGLIWIALYGVPYYG